MSKLDILWQPVRIGSISARNRIYLPSQNLSLPPDECGAYLAERARGGVGLIITQGFHVHPATGKPGVSPWKPEWADSVRKIVQPAKSLGCPVIVQLTHMGVSGVRRTDDIALWGPLLGPSAIPSAAHRVIPKPMDQADIEQVIEGFAATAAHAQAGGADGAEIHGSHGYLLSNFLSPYWNRRNDAWGGDAERRARLVLEVGRAVRKRCGTDFAIGIKLSLDEYLGDAGTTPEKGLQTLALLHQARLFDYVCLSHTSYHNIHRLAPPAASGETAPLAAHGAAAIAVVGGEIPVLLQGAVRDIATGAQIVQRGQASMVGLARAHIADPALVLKARSGRIEETVRCVGANQGCWRRMGQAVSCTVNPVAGREAIYGMSVLRPQAAPRKLLVIGGGPAGMKFADTATSLGHRVSLWESAAHLGGQLRHASRLPDQDAWGYLVDDLGASLQRRGVDLRLGTDATPEAIADFAADHIVLATGSQWQTDGFSTRRPEREGLPRGAGAQLLDPVSVLDNPQACGRKVLIVDDNGDHLPLALARLLASLGREVTVVSSDTLVGRRLEGTLDLPWLLPRLAQESINVRTATHVERVEPGWAVLRGVYGTDTERVEADTVVLCMMRRSNDALYQPLIERNLPVTRIGDCLAPREVDDAVLEGFREAHAVR